MVIGNPPYSVSSWNNGAWILDLTEDYKRNVRIEESQIQSLSNDYIKFIRLGQWCIDSSDIGLLGLITGHGYLHGTQYRDLRLCLSRSFSKSFLLDLHGSVRRSRSEATVDEPVFEIMTGVAICLAVRSRTAHSSFLGQSSQRSLTGALANKFGTLSTSTVLALHDGVAGHLPVPPFYSFLPLRQRLPRWLRSIRLSWTCRVALERGIAQRTKRNTGPRGWLANKMTWRFLFRRLRLRPICVFSQSQSLTRTCVADIDFARRVNGVTRRPVRGREPMSGGTLWVG